MKLNTAKGSCKVIVEAIVEVTVEAIVETIIEATVKVIVKTIIEATVEPIVGAAGWTLHGRNTLSCDSGTAETPAIGSRRSTVIRGDHSLADGRNGSRSEGDGNWGNWTSTLLLVSRHEEEQRNGYKSSWENSRVQTNHLLVKAVQPERIMIEVPKAPDKVLSVGIVAVTQVCTRKGYTLLGSEMGLQQCSLHTIWVSLRSAKKKEVLERWTEPID
ncbi:hypothetical protein GGU10DRAFT_337479 [Lentinula aff. detonsa]|uniref:Uncharacterized protein n=1 Tax=Lentinula aff. detonsa TaxID=2804958 RepID=A0AA38KW94_9AGAR|nr:hypothetical protein GGU10DRAFT_337479 [Lentinula aff. detonsa]